MNTWFDLTTCALGMPPADGIARVEINIAKALLNNDNELRFCFFYSQTQNFCELPKSSVNNIIERYLNPTKSTNFDVEIGVSNNTNVDIFNNNDKLLIPGIHCRQKVLDRVAIIRQHINLRCAFVIYDVMPWKYPYWYGQILPELLRELDSQLRLGEHFFCISKNTENDYHSFAKSAANLAPSTSSFILGTNTILPEAMAIDDVLQTIEPNIQEVFLQCIKQQFILMVGTLIPRKGHETILHVYARLLLDEPKLHRPILVLVGDVASNGQASLYRIQQDNALQGAVIHLSRLSDAGLDYLYRNCLFTVYPSHYEGWGLPVAESLSYGKHCITGIDSSLAEVGGGFADNIDPLDVPAWQAKVYEYINNPKILIEKEQIIKKSYVSPSWDEAAKSLLNW